MSKENVKIKDQQLEDLKKLIDDALARILSLKTKLTYQEEVTFISNTIKEYIETTYVTKVFHEQHLLEQLFGWINHFKKIQKNIAKKYVINDAQVEGLQLAIDELEKLSGDIK